MLEVFRPNFSSIQRVYYESNLNFSSIQRLNFYEDDKVSEAPSNDAMLPPKLMPHISCSRQQTSALGSEGRTTRSAAVMEWRRQRWRWSGCAMAQWAPQVIWEGLW
jgi:hypothetical protein